MTKNKNNSNQISVALSAPSNNGIAILKTEYSLDNGKTWDLYQKEVVFDKPGKYNIKYRSVDVAGNVEETREQTINVK
jgi:hypothetical protein